MARLRVRHVFAAALVTIAACDDPITDPTPIDAQPYDAEEFISENPPAPDGGMDADIPKGVTAQAAPVGAP